MPPLIPYNRSYSFIPTPIPGARINIELDNVGLSLNGAINAIKDVRRDDGELKNEIVTLDSLSPQVRAGIGAGALEARDAAVAAQAIAEDARDDAVSSAAAAATSAVHATSALEGAQLAQEQATAARTGAQTARDFAAQWSSAPEDQDVDDGVNPVNKSAYHWAQVALAAAAGSIADGSVTTAKLANGALSADSTGRAKMADGFVTSAKIADGILSADTTGRAKMADGFINAAKLADGAVTAAKLGSDVVSAQTAKAAPVDADAILIADSAASNVPKKLSFGNLRAWIQSWLPFIKSYESSELTIAGGGAFTLAHGLGVTPKTVQFFLICKTAELNYAVGDVVPIGDSYYTSSSATQRGLVSWLSPTEIALRIVNDANPFALPNKTTGTVQSLTNGNWRIVVRAWA